MAQTEPTASTDAATDRVGRRSHPTVEMAAAVAADSPGLRRDAAASAAGPAATAAGADRPPEDVAAGPGTAAAAAVNVVRRRVRRPDAVRAGRRPAQIARRRRRRWRCRRTHQHRPARRRRRRLAGPRILHAEAQCRRHDAPGRRRHDRMRRRRLCGRLRRWTFVRGRCRWRRGLFDDARSGWRDARGGRLFDDRRGRRRRLGRRRLGGDRWFFDNHRLMLDVCNWRRRRHRLRNEGRRRGRRRNQDGLRLWRRLRRGRVDGNGRGDLRALDEPRRRQRGRSFHRLGRLACRFASLHRGRACRRTTRSTAP